MLVTPTQYTDMDILVWTVIGLFMVPTQAQLSHEQHVLNTLLVRKSIRVAEEVVRPVADWRDPVKVEVGLAVTRVWVERLEQGLVGINLLMFGRWRDEYIQWRREDHDGLEQIQCPADGIWKPDPLRTNNNIMSRINQDLPLVVAYDGTVKKVVPSQIVMWCDKGNETETSVTLNCRFVYGAEGVGPDRIDLVPWGGMDRVDVSYTDFRDGITVVESKVNHATRSLQPFNVPMTNLIYTLSISVPITE